MIGRNMVQRGQGPVCLKLFLSPYLPVLRNQSGRMQRKSQRTIKMCIIGPPIILFVIANSKSSNKENNNK